MSDASEPTVRWSEEEEILLAEWGDYAKCYCWLHQRSHHYYAKRNTALTIPVAILSTITGTASFGASSIFSSEYFQTGQFIIGGLGVLVGVLTTVNNYLRYAQRSEGHRIAAILWDKLGRDITVQVALPVDLRDNAMSFLKRCRAEFDRLIEQSSPIPDAIIVAFRAKFSKEPNLHMPEVCNGIRHTAVAIRGGSDMMPEIEVPPIPEPPALNIVADIVNGAT